VLAAFIIEEISKYLRSFITLIIDAGSISETPVNYQTARPDNPKDSHLSLHELFQNYNIVTTKHYSE
jgi:hypothetical protein